MRRQVRAVSTATADCLRRVDFEGLCLTGFQLLQILQAESTPCKVEHRVIVGWVKHVIVSVEKCHTRCPAHLMNVSCWMWLVGCPEQRTLSLSLID